MAFPTLVFQKQERNHQHTDKYPEIATVVLVPEPALGGSVNQTLNVRQPLQQFVAVVSREVAFSSCTFSGFVIC